jgi:hypothetical protein
MVTTAGVPRAYPTSAASGTPISCSALATTTYQATVPIQPPSHAITAALTSKRSRHACTYDIHPCGTPHVSLAPVSTPSPPMIVVQGSYRRDMYSATCSASTRHLLTHNFVAVSPHAACLLLSTQTVRLYMTLAVHSTPHVCLRKYLLHLDCETCHMSVMLTNLTWTGSKVIERAGQEHTQIFHACYACQAAVEQCYSQLLPKYSGSRSWLTTLLVRGQVEGNAHFATLLPGSAGRGEARPMLWNRILSEQDIVMSVNAIQQG